MYYTDKDLYNFGITDYYKVLNMKDKIENKHESLVTVIEKEFHLRKLDIAPNSNIVATNIERVILQDMADSNKVIQINDALKVIRLQKSKFKHSVNLCDSSWEDGNGCLENKDKFIYMVCYIQEIEDIYYEKPVKQTSLIVEPSFLYNKNTKDYSKFRRSGLEIERNSGVYTVNKADDSLTFILTVKQNLEVNNGISKNHGSEFILYIVSD